MKRLSELREKVIFNRNGIKEDYSTCVWNNKPLSKDDNCCTPPQANKPRFARSVSSIPQNGQGPLARKAVIVLNSHQVVLGTAVCYIPWEQSLTSPGSNVPAGVGVAQPDDPPGSVLYL